MILGIDEVGRGSWAGPLVIGAVVLGDANIDGLTDSKKISKSKRIKLDVEIRNQAAGFGLGWVAAAELDEIGLSQALRLATRRAVEQVDASYQQIIIDGTVNFLADTTKGEYVTVMKKADLLIASVSAASIIAKVARDNYMTKQAGIYPGYGFEAHVGYGTKAHREAIAELGVTPEHRRSFAPLKQYAPAAHTTKTIGDEAETAVCGLLERRGHVVMVRNWKTRFCEVDIISSHGNVVYFTEVKYRKNQLQGGGMAAITNDKLRRMKRAVTAYVQRYPIGDNDVRLQVASLSGEPIELDELLELA